MALPTIDDIVNLIDDDITVFDVIKSNSMTEKAVYAREALSNPDHYDIRFGRYSGEKYTFAVYNPDEDQWWDITGHYHFSPPDEKIRTLKERLELREEKNNLILKLVIKARKELGLSDNADDIEDYYENYYKVRNSIKKKCEICGRSGGGTRYEWHHIDQTLRKKLIAAQEVVKSIDPMADPKKYYDATLIYIKNSLNYYTPDISQTILLCKKCHAGIHAGKINLPERRVNDKHALV